MRLPLKGEAARGSEAHEGQLVDTLVGLTHVRGPRDDAAREDVGRVLRQRLAGEGYQAVLADAARTDDGDKAAAHATRSPCR